MPPPSCRMRLAVTCALVVALTASFTLEPALAQPAAGSWQVAESVNFDTVGFAPALSPDGRWVAGLKDLDQRQLCIWKVSTGEECCNGESHRVADASIAWSPDSRRVAYSQNGHQLDSDVFVLDVRNISLTNLTEDEVDDLKAASIASQRQISLSRAILETGQVVRGLELVTDEPLALVAETVGLVTPLLWLADDIVVFAIRGGPDITGVYTSGVTSGLPVRIDTDPAIPVSKTPVLTGATASGDRLSFHWLWEDIAIDDELYTFGWFDRASGELTPLTLAVPLGEQVAAPLFPRWHGNGVRCLCR